jgi:hypothetical protein
MSRPLLIVASTVVLGVLAAVSTIRALRRRSYRRWPRLLRWPFYAAVAALVTLGAVGLVSHYIETWGAPAAAWFLIAPLAYGLWRGWPAGRRSS